MKNNGDDKIKMYVADLEKDFQEDPRKPKQANARKAAKLARKIAKNEFMYREAGQRPWTSVDIMRHMPFLLRYVSSYRGRHECMRSSDGIAIRMKHLREPSGFMAMSRVAEEMKHDNR